MTLLTEWYRNEQLRPPPPKPPGDFLSTLQPGDELEMSSQAKASASMSGGADADDERELIETALSACVDKLAADIAGYAQK